MHCPSVREIWIKKREDNMDENKKDPIPDEFASLEEAGEFWDTHSAADYWEEMEEVEMEFNIQRRTFLLPVQDSMYQRLRKKAKKEKRSVEEMLNMLLERELA